MELHVQHPHTDLYLLIFAPNTAVSESNPHSDEVIKTLKEDSEGPGMPLPELQLLNLANNEVRCYVT